MTNKVNIGSSNLNKLSAAGLLTLCGGGALLFDSTASHSTRKKVWENMMEKITMRKRYALAMCAIAGVAVLSLSLAGAAQAAEGWQGISTVNVTKGEVNLQWGYNCPAAFPVAVNGAFAMNPVGQASEVYLTFNASRIDLNSFGEWGWHFYWPAGAPAGVSIFVDIYCVAK